MTFWSHLSTQQVLQLQTHWNKSKGAMEGKEVQHCTMMLSNAEAHLHDMTLTPATETLRTQTLCAHSVAKHWKRTAQSPIFTPNCSHIFYYVFHFIHHFYSNWVATIINLILTIHAFSYKDDRVKVSKSQQKCSRTFCINPVTLCKPGFEFIYKTMSTVIKEKQKQCQRVNT